MNAEWLRIILYTDHILPCVFAGMDGLARTDKNFPTLGGGAAARPAPRPPGPSTTPVAATIVRNCAYSLYWAPSPAYKHNKSIPTETHACTQKHSHIGGNSIVAITKLKCTKKIVVGLHTLNSSVYSPFFDISHLCCLFV